jgi:leucyl aminopeptidase (aminopeptidase T)
MIGSKHGSRVSSSSNVHYDFMIGGPDVDVFGVRKDGSEEPIMVQGDWSESTGA